MAFKMKGPYHKAFKNVGKSGMNEGAYKKVTQKSSSKDKGEFEFTIKRGPSSKEKEKTVVK